MIVLGFDTATTVCSVGISENGYQLALESIDSSASHSLHLLPMIESVLKKCGLPKESIDLIAAGGGPGSFTGIRISVTAAKTLAFAMGKPCVAVNTLDAMAHCIAGDFPGRNLCPVIDARKHEVYWKYFCNDEHRLESKTDDMLTPVERIGDTCPPGTVFFGNGALAYAEYFKKFFGDKLTIAGPANMYATGYWIAELGRRGMVPGAETHTFDLSPTYLRRPEAEVQWRKKFGKDAGKPE